MDIRSAVLAARDGKASTVQAYLDAGGAPDYTDHTGVRLLHIAAKNRHVDVVRTLLGVKADPNVQDSEGQTPLYEAVNEFHCRRVADHRARSLEISQLLLAAGAVPDRGYRLPLAEAAKNGNAEVVQLLLERGASVNQRDPRYASTALIAAVNGAQPAVVTLLVDAGADVNQGDRRGQTPLIRAIEGPGTKQDSEEARNLWLPIARFLVGRGANVNQAMEGGRSPLMSAVNENWPAMIRFLLDAGADARHVDDKGCGLARRAMDGVLRLSLPDGPALDLVRSMVDAGAGDVGAAADCARQRGRPALAYALAQLE
jgi:ankyrin repeat protein